MAIAINSLYTHKHGYDLVVERSPPDSTRAWAPDHSRTSGSMNFSFSKPWVLLRQLYTHDVVLYLDSDAYFRNFSRTLEEFMEEHMSDWEGAEGGEGLDERGRDGQGVAHLPEMIMTWNCFSKAGCWTQRSSVNAGVLLFKSTPRTIDFMEQWALRPDTSGCAFLYEHYDQACLLDLTADDKYKWLIKRLDQEHASAMQLRDGVFITHLVGMGQQEREEAMMEALAAAYSDELGLKVTIQRT